MSTTEIAKAGSSARKNRKPRKASKRPTLAERKRAAGLKGMKDNLFEKYEEILQIQKELDIQEGNRKYAIGVHVAKIVYEMNTYGKSAVKQLAKAIGLDKSTLTDYGMVAWIWELQEFNDLMKREGRLNRGISFSHLIEIAVWNDRKVREDWIERVLEEGLSVRSLRQAMGAKKDEQAVGSSGAKAECQDDGHKCEEVEIPAGVRRSIARLSSDVKSIPVKTREWDARVIKPLEDDPGQVNEAVICGLIEKREANIEAIKTLQNENRQIDEILKGASRAKQDLAIDKAEGGEQDV